MANSNFETWAKGFSGCHGGYIEKSIWICGIEWGGQYNNEQELLHEFKRDVTKPPEGYCSEEGNLASPYDRNILKIITAIYGEEVSKYGEVNDKQQPFVKNSSGQYKFFKMNLFPIAFRNTNINQWNNCFKTTTGFKDKEEYINWCCKHRFPIIKSWVNIYKPKLIICFGKDNLDCFKEAFTGVVKKSNCCPNLNSNHLINAGEKVVSEDNFPVLGKKLHVCKTNNNVVIVVCPFPGGRHGLNSNELLNNFGKEIKKYI